MRRFSWLVWLCACNAPGIDPTDLKGVFDAPLSRAAASASASTSASAAPAPEEAALPVFKRTPIAEPCVEPGGTPAAPDQRPVGRPACRRARILEHRDADGTPRYACVFEPSGSAERAPLPLVLFLHDAYDDPSAVHKKTRLRKLSEDLDLTGDPRRRGFVVLAPQARRIQGRPRFDRDYRTRANADVVAIDGFIDELSELVDTRRIYAVGAGEGGEMAALYAMVRADRVAAFGLFAAAPKELRWSCKDEPTPALAIYRSCDAVTECADVEQWLSQREREHAVTQPLRLGSANRTEPSCATSRHTCGGKQGTADHLRWPKERERELLEYLARFQLDVSG
jgi:poly(3-hydroxybutyrate) depolymerase